VDRGETVAVEEEIDEAVEQDTGQEDITMVSLEIPVNDFEAAKLDMLREAGVDVEQVLANALQMPAENQIHNLYQQVRQQSQGQE